MSASQEQNMQDRKIALIRVNHLQKMQGSGQPDPAQAQRQDLRRIPGWFQNSEKQRFLYIYIYIYIYKYILFILNKGKRIKLFASDQIVGDSGQYSKMSKIIGETELSADSYPYTFTVVPSTFNKGEEQDFTIDALCTDKGFSLVPSIDFDNK